MLSPFIQTELGASHAGSVSPPWILWGIFAWIWASCPIQLIGQP